MANDKQLYLFLGVYSAATAALFHFVNKATQQVVDEEFHIRQAKQYCQGNFHIWDPKITTFPGLYILSALFLGPFQACTVFNLRLISALASIVNVYLIYKIRQTVATNLGKTALLWETASLATLPPLYFFSHLYYTDVLSVTAVLGLLYCALTGRDLQGTVCALLAIFMRQTNVVWVGFIVGSKLVNTTLAESVGNKSKKAFKFADLFTAARNVFRKPVIISRVLNRTYKSLLGYCLCMLAFVGFVHYNGSIVLGDKSAHEAALHLPQICYFSVFLAAFSIAHVLGSCKRVCRFAFKNWYLSVACMAVLGAMILTNTIVHPYLLADNRHYTFYVWNKFYGRYWFARYVPIPGYYLALVLIGVMLFSATGKQTVGHALLWTVASLVSIALQQMIEVRYFLLPFLVLRLLQAGSRPALGLVRLEFLVNLLVNAGTFYVFFTKEFYWRKYPEVQRIMW